MVAVSIELEGNSGEGDLLWLFVCQDCQDNKISQSQTEYLKQHKFTFLIFLDSGSPRPSCEKIRFFLSPLSWLPDGQLLNVSSHSRKNKFFGFSSPKESNLIMSVVTPSPDFI